MAKAKPSRTPVEEEAEGVLLGILQTLSKKRYNLLKKKLKDCEVPAGYERIPESSLQCAHRAELASLIIRHYGAHYGLELMQQLLDSLGPSYTREKGTLWMVQKQEFARTATGDPLEVFHGADLHHFRSLLSSQPGSEKSDIPRDFQIHKKKVQDRYPQAVTQGGLWIEKIKWPIRMSYTRLKPSCSLSSSQSSSNPSNIPKNSRITKMKGLVSDKDFQNEVLHCAIMPEKIKMPIMHARDKGNRWLMEAKTEGVTFAKGAGVDEPFWSHFSKPGDIPRNSKTPQEKGQENPSPEEILAETDRGLEEELIELAVECELCGTVPDTIKLHTRKDGDKYRLELPYEGRFRCSETGIQFCVESPTFIEFELSSWEEYLGYLEQYSYQIVGPLFNITVKSGLVSAVYLPHYVCLRGGHIDAKELRVVHYKDDNMVLETTAAVLPFYVVLKQPTFSPIGVLLLRKLPSRVRRNIPTHGAVFIYCRYIKGYTLHLYLVPQDPSLKKALDKEESENGFSWVAKPPKTSTVFSRRIYTVGGPDKAKINPKGLRLSFDDRPAMYNYSEIYLHNVDDEISLSVTCTSSQSAIWAALLRREDLMPRAQIKEQDRQHFVDRHRAALIKRVSHIDPILDELLGDGTLTQEQYDTVRSKGTPQERMRQLYDCIKTWGTPDKDALYFTLSVHNKPLIKHLLHSGQFSNLQI